MASGQSLHVSAVLTGAEQTDYTDLFESWARSLGTRMPNNRRPGVSRPADRRIRPLLTRSLSPEILYGYGDPWVLKLADSAEPYLLVVTSNDAPNVFPILRSSDLHDWRSTGFAFPEGSAPPWAKTGPGIADFWAPEIHRLGARFVLCFAARQQDGELAVGLAVAEAPQGPYRPQPAPLVTGGVIDAHMFVDEGGEAWLFWKHDSNDRWPSLLCALLHERPDLISEIFEDEENRRTGALYSALWPWARTLEPMERFFALQVLIEAVVSEFAAVKRRLRERPMDGLADRVGEILAAMRTPVQGQRLKSDSLTLFGEPIAVIENDLEWEGPLIEGMCLVRAEGRYFLFYSGNDFSTAQYGVGYAVAPSVAGPWRKAAEPLLRSTAEWWGPGHPSLAEGPDGDPTLFLHAYPAGKAAYKAFRALLAARLRFDGDEVEVV